MLLGVPQIPTTTNKLKKLGGNQFWFNTVISTSTPKINNSSWRKKWNERIWQKPREIKRKRSYMVGESDGTAARAASFSEAIEGGGSKWELKTPSLVLQSLLSLLSSPIPTSVGSHIFFFYWLFPLASLPIFMFQGWWAFHYQGILVKEQMSRWVCSCWLEPMSRAIQDAFVVALKVRGPWKVL